MKKTKLVDVSALPLADLDEKEDAIRAICLRDSVPFYVAAHNVIVHKDLRGFIK